VYILSFNMEMDISLPKAGIFVTIYFDESSIGFFQII
jgi:hypothetical protein